VKAVEAFGLSEIAGHDRNEDAWACRPELGVFVVADGMGGGPGAAQASRTAVEAFWKGIEGLAPRERLDDAALRRVVADVNRAVMALAEADPALTGLGTTLSGAVLADGALRLVHVGDSRIYRHRGGAIEQLTPDHTVAAELVALERLSREGARKHPLRGMLSRYVGSTRDASPEIVTVDARGGDWLLLATDGLTAVLADEDITALLAAAPPRAEARCRTLVEAALARNPPDNVTLVSFEVPS
jgi:protein phosphatase